MFIKLTTFKWEGYRTTGSETVEVVQVQALSYLDKKLVEALEFGSRSQWWFNKGGGPDLVVLLFAHGEVCHFAFSGLGYGTHSFIKALETFDGLTRHNGRQPDIGPNFS